MGYFKSADVNILKTDSPGIVDIEIEIEENLTGSFSFGIGYDSVEKTSLAIGLQEKNFLGKGIKTRILINTSEKSTKYNIGITEPYFQDTPLSLSEMYLIKKLKLVKKTSKRLGLNLV